MRYYKFLLYLLTYCT